jgi:hypothetical protein
MTAEIIMALNRKLTPIITGRKIESIEQADKSLSIHFSDGSIMKIKTAAPIVLDALNAHTVKSIRQKGATFTLVFDDETTVAIALADPGSSVTLRDAKGALEYVD